MLHNDLPVCRLWSPVRDCWISCQNRCSASGSGWQEHCIDIIGTDSVTLAALGHNAPDHQSLHCSAPRLSALKADIIIEIIEYELIFKSSHCHIRVSGHFKVPLSECTSLQSTSICFKKLETVKKQKKQALFKTCCQQAGLKMCWGVEVWTEHKHMRPFDAFHGFNSVWFTVGVMN